MESERSCSASVSGQASTHSITVVSSGWTFFQQSIDSFVYHKGINNRTFRQSTRQLDNSKNINIEESDNLWDFFSALMETYYTHIPGGVRQWSLEIQVNRD